jgi:glc operon protein GlcG
MKATLIAALVLAGALSAEAPKPGSVTFIESSRVAAAFAKGMPLVEIENYKVHASHRDGPGMVEIHERDTDIVYVLDGTTTLVTGGEAVDAKTTAPEELRGVSIRGGSERRLSKGDVVIIPNGVPHWFKEVPGPLNYYVVKVRSEK